LIFSSIFSLSYLKRDVDVREWDEDEGTAAAATVALVRRCRSHATLDGMNNQFNHLFFNPDCLRFLGISMAMLRRERLAMGRLWRLKLEQKWVERGRAAIIAEATTETKPATSRIQRCMGAANNAK
jgi:hypothetical protein